jgi:ArsR family transcriptional regulator, zinc-responsive transcriptional repressor
MRRTKPERAAMDNAATLLRALGNATRLGILRELGAGERCVHELVESLDLRQPVVSQHLRVLRGERLVAGRRRGKEVAYTLTDTHIARIVDDAMRHSHERRSRV